MWMNLPNSITCLRILFIPVFLVVLLTPLSADSMAQVYAATILFLLAAATDSLDGYLARSRGQVTNLGKFLDPLADKLLVSAALIALVQLGSAAAWVVWIILGREFAVTGLRAIAAAEGLVVAASGFGKVKTVVQMTAITFLLLKKPLVGWLGVDAGTPLLYLALILTVGSGIDYFWKCRSLFGR